MTRRQACFALGIPGMLFLGGLVALVLAGWSNPDSTEPAPRREGVGESPRPPAVDQQAAENRPLHRCVVTDAEDRPIRGLGKSRPSGGGPNLEYCVHIEGVEDGKAESVVPDSTGGFVPPPGPATRLVRLMAVPLDQSGRILVSERDWALGQLPGARVRLVGSADTGLSISCKDGAGKMLAARVRVARRIGSADHVTVARLAIPEEGTSVRLRSGPGRYLIFVDWFEGLGTEQSSPLSREMYLRAGATADCVFEIPVRASLKVELLDTAGQGLTGALVDLKYRDADRWRLCSKSPIRDESGSYVFLGLPPGPCIVQVSAPQCEPHVEQLVLLEGQDRTIQVSMRRGGHRFKVTLTTGSDAPLPTKGWSGFLVRRGVRPGEVQAFRTGRFTGPGAFEATGLAAGEYEVTFMGRANGTSVRAVLLAAINGRDLDLGTLSLDRVLTSGKSRASVRVDCESPKSMKFSVLSRHDTWPRELWRLSQHLEGVAADLEGLEPGAYEFKLSHANMDPSKHDLRASARVVVRDPDSPPASVRIEVPVLR